MNDLYSSNTFSQSSDSDDFANVLDRLERLERTDAMHTACMSEDDEQKAGRKKLKKRVKALKKENESLKAQNDQLLLNLQFYAMQQQQPKKSKKSKKSKKHKNKKSEPVWWQEAFIKSMPVAINNLTQVRSLLPGSTK
ncbi:MAG: hypothetical protein LBM69_01125 [Lachnospiraceae bacterium]|jgi:hypothetical protein|nr:hypothetical protein [Lachnospiraceae bacterium]